MSFLDCAAQEKELETKSPYVSETSREIKALSAEDISGYLQGQGMGFAKAAELNGFPGPKHVLDLSDELELSHLQSEVQCK